MVQFVTGQRGASDDVAVAAGHATAGTGDGLSLPLIDNDDGTASLVRTLLGRNTQTDGLNSTRLRLLLLVGLQVAFAVLLDNAHAVVVAMVVGLQVNIAQRGQWQQIAVEAVGIEGIDQTAFEHVLFAFGNDRCRWVIHRIVFT